MKKFKGWKVESHTGEVAYYDECGLALSRENDFDLIQQVKELAKEKGLLDSLNPNKQLLKVVEEVRETVQALNKQQGEQLKEEFGDIIFSSIVFAEHAGLDFMECLELVYLKNKERDDLI